MTQHPSSIMGVEKKAPAMEERGCREPSGPALWATEEEEEGISS